MNTGEIYFHKQCSVVMSCSHTDRPHFRLRQIPVQQTVYIISLEQGNIIIYCLLSYCFLVPICDHLNIILLILTGNGVVDNKLFMRDTHSIRFTSIKAVLLLADVICLQKKSFLGEYMPSHLSLRIRARRKHQCHTVGRSTAASKCSFDWQMKPFFFENCNCIIDLPS